MVHRLDIESALAKSQPIEPNRVIYSPTVGGVLTDQLQRADVDEKQSACKFDDPEGLCCSIRLLFDTKLARMGAFDSEVDFELVNPFNRVPNWINLQRDVTQQRDELTFIRSIAFVKRAPAGDRSFVMQRQFKHSRRYEDLRKIKIPSRRSSVTTAISFMALANIVIKY